MENETSQPQDKANSKSDKPTLRRASEVEIRPVNWLLNDVIVRRAINSIQGIAGIGKTYLLCAIAAAVSCGGYIQGVSGKMEQVECGVVLFLTGDDDESMTIIPRLMEFGANLDNIFVLPEYELYAIGSKELAKQFETYRPLLVIFDTLQHFLPPKTEINSAISATNALRPLNELAQKYDCAALIVQHVSKHAASGRSGHSVNFGIGSTAINGLFRSVWTLGQVKNDDDTLSDLRALAPSKTNLVAGRPPALLFRLSKERGFEWGGTDSNIDANQFYEDKSEKRERCAPARQEAVEFLEEMLDEGAVLAEHIKHEAQKRGITEKTLRDARENIGVKTFRGKGEDKKWYWQLAPDDA